MSPWVSVVLFGFAVFGLAWLTPKRSQGEEGSGIVGDAAYDRLLEDLEMENRELVDAVTIFKQEQDQTVHRLGNRIVELERQMKVWTEQPLSASAAKIPAPEAPSIPDSAAAPDQAQEAAAQPAADIESDRDEADLPPSSIRVRYAELIALHNKGRSMDQIAKSAGMNKGEVQLILQLARREEEQLA
ncbi:MAG: hypothetical protein JWR03_2834 [Cohnella sp.]|jgi:hypothetical protein|nr:hypothetical protein [Cohnella sp.]